MVIRLSRRKSLRHLSLWFLRRVVLATLTELMRLQCHSQCERHATPEDVYGSNFDAFSEVELTADVFVTLWP